MAAREEDLRPTTNLKSFKDVSKLGNVKLKQICKNLGVDIEESFGKKALVNVVCNSLGILKLISSPYCALSRVCLRLLFCFM